MKFEVKLEYDTLPPNGISNPVIVWINEQSYLTMIYSDGMKLANTGFPQAGIDYNCENEKRCARVIGVDLL